MKTVLFHYLFYPSWSLLWLLGGYLISWAYVLLWCLIISLGFTVASKVGYLYWLEYHNIGFIWHLFFSYKFSIHSRVYPTHKTIMGIYFLIHFCILINHNSKAESSQFLLYQLGFPNVDATIYIKAFDYLLLDGLETPTYIIVST